MKGIILAGGAGSRLYPMTQVFTKQLQPIYDKPMIYYPLSLLMLGGIKDVLIISTPTDIPAFEALLGDGSRYGIQISYKIQENPSGIPEAFILGEDFMGAEEDVALILGDNLFYGDFDFFRKAFKNQIDRIDGKEARIFAYSVSDPERYGVVEFCKKTSEIKSIEEKPIKPKSSYAIPGLYFFPRSVINKTKNLKPSKRGETEITDLINSYWNEGVLGVERINRGVAWLDTGTPKSLLDASSFIGAIEERQGLKVACLEEIALRMNYLSYEEFEEIVSKIPNSTYKIYLEKIGAELKR
ncbi:MAG: glucose-1-phosphate thymidylyltransferase [Bacteriovoracaceae bacterium]|jgi:glucose-1-phosphate thymidylyltransferase